MAESTSGAKAESPKISQGRSPNYPYIPLGEAVRRAEQVRDAGAVRQEMPPETFYQIWGMGALSSGARQTMAALNHFGLVDYVGRGDERTVKLSDLAIKIVLDRQPMSAERVQALAEAALKPPIHQALYDKYKNFLPADVVLRTFLTRDKGYNDEAALALIEEYRATLAYSGLSEPANMPPASQSTAVETPLLREVAIGDLVQVEINGALQFEKPARVRAIQDHEGQKWVFVEGSETGIPMEQVKLEQKGEGSAKGEIKPPVLALPDIPPAKGVRKEVFALEEGDVVLTFPDNLSAASFHDLQSYLALFLRKAQRRATAGDFFAEVYAPDGLKAKEFRYFDDFQSTLQFVVAFKKSASGDILRVHLPSRASDEDRQKLIATGAQLV